MKHSFLYIVGLLIVGYVALFWLLPGFFLKSEKSCRLACMDNLMSIARASKAYASSHEGAFPPDWHALAAFSVGDTHIEPSVFVCRGTGTKPGSMAEVESWAEYILVPGVLVGDPPETVLAYDLAVHHGGDGAPVLYIDGSVGWKYAAEISQLRTKDGQQLRTQ
jgi:hypothetical protein